jgi:hypothetical protein
MLPFFGIHDKLVPGPLLDTKLCGCWIPHVCVWCVCVCVCVCVSVCIYIFNGIVFVNNLHTSFRILDFFSPVLGFELRDSCLIERHSTTWAMPPAPSHIF